MRTIILSGIFFSLLSIQVNAQMGYLPIKLGNQINSEYPELNPVPEPNGSALYFSRVDHPDNRYGIRGSQDIWVSYKDENGRWLPAERLPDAVNLTRYNALFWVSEDGKRFLINGTYNKKGAWKKRGLSFIERTEDSWSLPEALEVGKLKTFNRGDYSTATMNKSGNILVMSMSKKLHGKKQNLYYSSIDDKGKWSSLKKFPKNVNSKHDNLAPFISADGKKVYFTSNRDDKSDYNIYVSQRNDLSFEQWSDPVKLSDTINSIYWDAYYRTNPNESMAWYTRVENLMSQPNIYQIKLFEERPWVELQARIVDKNTGAVVSASRNFSLLVNDLPKEIESIDRQTGVFTVKLPFGGQFQLTPQMAKYNVDSAKISTTFTEEFEVRYKDFTAEAFDYASIKGSVYLKRTGMPLPASAGVRLIIDGMEASEVVIDSRTGAYSTTLPLGNNYKIWAEAKGYVPVMSTVELSQLEEFEEIEHNLYVELPKVALVSGNIIDRKSNEKPEAIYGTRIQINGEDVDNAQIDTLAGNYSIEVSLGSKYLINARIPGYYPVMEELDLSGEAERVRVMQNLFLVPLEVGQQVRLNNIFFDTGKSTLKPESHEELDRVVKFLSENPSVRIEIGGHTDNVGNASFNKNLSLRRAQAVAQYILSKGIPAEAITHQGYGMEKPIADNSTADGRSINRRVEFTIINK
ncbi:MAG: OmpA family protein [Cyclobacteriaceae bacterium]|nr:OmpA family protein [Cyclobacteriaceae bacterium]